MTPTMKECAFVCQVSIILLNDCACVQCSVCSIRPQDQSLRAQSGCDEGAFYYICCIILLGYMSFEDVESFGAQAKQQKTRLNATML